MRNALLLPSLVICGAAVHAEANDPQRELPCYGFDGSFEVEVPGLADWWVVAEAGCPNPGASWTVVSCTSGETLDVRISGRRSDDQWIDLWSNVDVLREEYANLDAPPKLTKIISDLEAIGAEPIVRAEPLDPENFCKIGTVSDEGEAKL